MPFTRRFLLSPNDTDTCLYRGLALRAREFWFRSRRSLRIDWGTCVASAAPLLKDDDLPPEARRDLVTVLIQLMMQPDGLYHGLLSTDIAPVAARVQPGRQHPHLATPRPPARCPRLRSTLPARRRALSSSTWVHCTRGGARRAAAAAHRRSSWLPPSTSSRLLLAPLATRWHSVD